jgi:hypothetical protein
MAVAINMLPAIRVSLNFIILDLLLEFPIFICALIDGSVNLDKAYNENCYAR